MAHYHEAATGQKIATDKALDIRGSVGGVFEVVHGAFPFMELISGPEKEKWNSLTYHLPEYENRPQILRHLATPDHSTPTPLVFLYRNPFDHIVSMYDHAMDHRHHHRFMNYETPSGNKKVISSIFEFAMYKILDCYIKQRKSFELASSELGYPVIFVQYEDYVSDKHRTIAQIFKFFGINYDKESLDISIEKSSEENMLKLEDKINLDVSYSVRVKKDDR